tara:strand:+ start:25290 stop:26747 length:1458 start_codon:yes stop_codon:yes gene_type:complete
MDVTKEKSDVFGQIAALRVSAEGYPKKLLSNSIASISQKTNSLNFLIDLNKALIGFESLKESLVEVLTYNLDEIELDIKQAIKKALKSMVSCSINPKIPQSFIDNGIDVELSKIDLLGMFKTSPFSPAGKLLYNDPNGLSDSTDFNTFLYNTIQGNTTGTWGAITTGNDILQIRFDEEGVSSELPNNTINIKPSEHYTNELNNKKLPDLNNDYIDSIKLFDSAKLINNIIESVFGTVSLSINKDKKQIKNEIKIQDIIDRIINTDCDMVIDDSYFVFTNEELNSIDSRVEDRRKGKTVVTTCDDVDSSIEFDTLTSLNDELTPLLNQPSTSQLIEITTTIVRNGLDALANDSASNVDEKDKLSIKINFIEKMLRHLMSAIVSVILSPKLIVILAVNHTIVHGEAFDNTEDFIKKNRGLITAVMQSIRDAIVGILMDKILKEIKILVTDNIIKTQIEKVKYKKAQIASLVGVPNDVLRQISGLINN